MGWFEDQQKVTAQQNQTAGDSQARVTALYQQILGRAPTARELAGWGNDIDEAYLGKISNALQSSAEGQSYRTTSTQGRIKAVYQELLGRDPTADELKQYGTNIDDRYLNTIRSNIANSDEAKAYSANPKKAADASTTTGGGDDWASKDYSNIDNVKAYFKSRGVDVSDQSAQYWADKYNSNEFAGDRSYFFQRLGQAEEFGGGGGGYNDLLAPFTENFSYDDFKAPTMDDLKNSPGFQASLDRASNILQRSAAAKGSLLSGSTAQALSDQTADLTTQGYGNLFNQAAATYSTNRGNAYDAYKERRANFYQNQDSPFAKLLAMSSLQEQDTNAQRQLALGYAGLGAQVGTGGAAQYNGLLTGGANAAASGVVGSNNAYSSLYGGVGNYAALLAALSGGRRTTQPVGGMGQFG